LKCPKGFIFDVDITKQKLHVVGPHQLDRKERKLKVPCFRVDKHTTWPKKYGVDDLTKYRGIEGTKKKQQERAEFVLSFYQGETRKEGVVFLAFTMFPFPR